MMRPILIFLASIGLTASLVPDATRSPNPFLQVGRLLELTDSQGTHPAATDLFKSIAEVAFDTSLFDHQNLVAFEENRFFVYALADTSKPSDGARQDRHTVGDSRLTRRFILLKPSTFVIDDEIQVLDPKAFAEWSLYSTSKPVISKTLIRFAEGNQEILCETLLPNKARRKEEVRHSGPEGMAEYAVKASGEGTPPSVRFLHVLQVRQQSNNESGPRSELVTVNQELELTIRTADRIFQLTLPSARTGAGEIAIATSGGKQLVETQPLASGILPHGVEGMRLLEEWDADYRRARPPLWDAGLPSSELRKVVEDGTIRPGRVVELGCGSGTDSVYLAGRGFDVTAIDIAPTALAQAQGKARKAGVQVRWLLADVLAAPILEPFDFIYDRGCYHEVRSQNLAAYLETVRRYSSPGTRFLLLAGSINETVLDFGPPRLAEEEIRDDFSSLFDFEWIRESRFEVAQPKALGPLAWSVLMRRKPAVK